MFLYFPFKYQVSMEVVGHRDIKDLKGPLARKVHRDPKDWPGLKETEVSDSRQKSSTSHPKNFEILWNNHHLVSYFLFRLFLVVVLM